MVSDYLEVREKELFLHRGIKVLFGGHCDLLRYYSDKKLLVIIDKKFGYKEVTPANSNLQLRTYAVMGAELHDCEHVVVAITQPRLPYDQRLTMAVYHREEIKQARVQLYAIWDASKAPDAPLVAGEEQCRYCKAKLICSAYQAKIAEITTIVPFPGNGTVAKRTATVASRLEECTDDQLGALIERIHFAEFIKDLTMEEARKRLGVEGRMPGWKLGKETEVREVTDAEQARTLMSDVIAPNAFMKACKVKLGKLEETLREYENCTWKEARDKVNTLLAPVLERKIVKPSVLRAKEALPER